MMNESCPVCNSLMNNKLRNWHWECSKCGYENAEFEPAINDEFSHQYLDEKLREKGLQSLRIENFDRILKAITNNGCVSGQILDVGCAHGWFLEAAKNRGFNALGIEPDFNVFQETARRGLSIRNGFFPDILGSSEQFDVIVFNDVFEHIPNIHSVLKGVAKHLKPEGMLVINLPSTSGPFYKIARLLQALGVSSFFDRLWQKGYPSPHIHYFNPDNLRLLLQINGFEEIEKGRLSTLRLRGLLSRISQTGDHSLVVSLGGAFFSFFAVPVIRIMPSDIIYSISKKNNLMK